VRCVPKDSACGVYRNVILPQVHAVSSSGERKVGAVVHDPVAISVLDRIADGFARGDKFTICQRFVPQLNQANASGGKVRAKRDQFCHIARTAIDQNVKVAFGQTLRIKGRVDDGLFERVRAIAKLFDIFCDLTMGAIIRGLAVLFDRSQGLLHASHVASNECQQIFSFELLDG